IARITLLAVLAQIFQLDARSLGADVEADDFPDYFVETFGAAVKGVRSVVNGQLVGFSVERELPFSNAIAVTSDQAAKEMVALDVTLERVMAEHHVAELAVLVGHGERDDGASVSENARFGAVAVSQRAQVDGRSVGHLA